MHRLSKIIDTDTIQNTTTQLPACKSKYYSGINHKIIRAVSDAMYLVFLSVKTGQKAAFKMGLNAFQPWFNWLYESTVCEESQHPQPLPLATTRNREIRGS